MKKTLLAMAVVSAIWLNQALAQTNVFQVSNSGPSAYVINGLSNPTLTVVRGSNYTFNINSPGHPFWIKTVAGTGNGNAFTNGVSGNGTPTGTLTFLVPMNAPNQLFYNCEFHGAMTGSIIVSNPPPALPTNAVIGSFELPGTLVFGEVTNAIRYRIEWSSAAGGSWTSFAAAASALDQIQPTGNGSITVSVPMLYRVVATFTNTP